MEHKISALFDLRIEMYRHALFRHYAIECDNFTNAMYYQFLYLDAEMRYADVCQSIPEEEYREFIRASMCIDYRY
jgi:hypothetical protein